MKARPAPVFLLNFLYSCSNFRLIPHLREFASPDSQKRSGRSKNGFAGTPEPPKRPKMPFWAVFGLPPTSEEENQPRMDTDRHGWRFSDLGPPTSDLGFPSSPVASHFRPPERLSRSFSGEK